MKLWTDTLKFLQKGEENEKGITIGIVSYNIDNANNDLSCGNPCNR